MKNENWDKLSEEHDSQLVNYVRDLIQEGRTRVLSPKTIKSEISCSETKVLALIGALENFDIIEKRLVFKCPNCEESISPEIAHGGVCDNCEIVFDELGEQPTEEIIYVVTSEMARNVTWLVTVHGMNTRGDWQQELSWGIANTYNFSIPIAIYKYGKIISGVFLRWRQRQLIDEFAAKLGLLPTEISDSKFLGKLPPDVIAHSFGTWLLGHVLTDPKYEEIRVGRVILTGCILRPDFDWEPLIKQGRVKSVLNHHGTKDLWAMAAHYFIPDSGPAGRTGFSSKQVINVPAVNFSHSEFFESENIKQFLSTEGLWHKFLTLPESQLFNVLKPKTRNTPWKETHILVREPLRYLLLFLLSFIVLSIGSMLILGIPDWWIQVKIIIQYFIS